jgi:hypothetical protein
MGTNVRRKGAMPMPWKSTGRLGTFFRNLRQTGKWRFWILAAVGDANFLGGYFQAGRDNLSKAMHCPDAIGNPFLHLRLGQCQFEIGNLERAADELTRALMGGGEEIFQEDDPKYWEFLKTKLEPPPGGWSEDGPENRPWWNRLFGRG